MKGPFRILCVQKNVVTIDGDGIQNILSIDRVTNAPSITDHTHRLATSAQPEPGITKDSTPGSARDHNRDKNKYIFDRIVKHIVKGDKLRYVVR